MSPIPTNRIVAFIGPYIAVISGVIADWLFVHLHFLSNFHTSRSAVAGYLTQATVFGITAILTWAGHHKWLTGWQQLETAAVQPPAAVAVAEQSPAPPTTTTAP